MNRNGPVEIADIACIRETQNAIICCKMDDDPDDRDVQFMIPKSQLDDDSEVKERGDTGTLVIPEWLARDRDLDYE